MARLAAGLLTRRIPVLRNTCHRSTWFLTVAWAAFSAAVAFPQEDRLISLDGEPVSGVITSIDSQGRIRGEKLPDNLELDGLRRIERSVAGAPAGGGMVLDLASGKLFATSISIGNEKCLVAWQFGDKLSLPIDVVRAIRFDPQTSLESFEAALKAPSPDNDRLFVRVDDKVQIISGLIEELGDDKVVFQYDNKQQSLPREKLFGIVTAQIGGGGTAEGTSLVELKDGSSIAGSVVSLTDGVLALKVSRSSKVELPWPAVAKLRVFSTRVAFLSDLEPTEVVEHSVVTTPRPWRRDRSVAGRTLTLGQRTFEKGIGVHSLCKLTFAAEGKYDFLAAVVGIDAETEGRGDCIFSVLGDGKELYAHRAKGADAPQEIKLDVRGIKQITLVVEPGEDLDLADHADWGDARLIRGAKTNGK